MTFRYLRIIKIDLFEAKPGLTILIFDIAKVIKNFYSLTGLLNNYCS
jgi:hypothetical protein